MEPNIPDPIGVESVTDNNRRIVISYEAMEFTFLVSIDGKTMERIGYKNYGSHVYSGAPSQKIENQCRQRAWVVFNANTKKEKEHTEKEVAITKAKASQLDLFARI